MIVLMVIWVFIWLLSLPSTYLAFYSHYNTKCAIPIGEVELFSCSGRISPLSNYWVWINIIAIVAVVSIIIVMIYLRKTK